jgi:hypothetical protein
MSSVISWGAPYSPAAWIPGRLLTNPLRDQSLERQNAEIDLECSR